MRDVTLGDLPLHLQRAPATAPIDAIYARLFLFSSALALTQNRANQLGYDPATYLDITKDREWLWA